MRGFHVFLVRHASIGFAAQRNSAFRSETEPLRPVNDRFCAGLDSDLVKPGVARFGQRLNKVHRAAVALLPVMKRQIPDLDRWDALELIARLDCAGLERGQTNRDLKDRSWRIRRA